jgi:hypothetical protein
MLPHDHRPPKWKPAATAAGVTGTSSDCRHTFASLLANEGRLLIYAAAQLGHSYVAMTGRYSHLFKNSDLAHRTPIADAITSARAKVAGENARSECDQDSGGVDETAPETTETPALAGVS